MKIICIQISSYKMFHDFYIDFCVDSSPADIVVIAGINGTGKTTLLRDILSHKEYKYDPTYSDGRVVFTSAEYPEGEPDSIASFAFNHKSEIVYLPSSTINLKKLTAYIVQYVEKFVFEDGRTSTEAYKELQQQIDLIFKDFHLGTRFYGMDRDRQLIFTNAQGDKFGINELSDGEKQILGKVFPLFTDEMSGKVILMDEPEESLHPSWQSNLVPVLRRCAKENNCQFILATHSPQIISSVRREELRLLVRSEDNTIKSVTCSEGPYGWTVEKVLSEIQGVSHFRVPEVEGKLEQLSNLIEKNEYETAFFASLWEEMERDLGYSDRDLILMRMEIRRKKKKHEENQ